MQNNIGGFLAKRAHLSPKLEALYDVANNLRLNYAEFNERVDRAANMISALGLKKGERVALLLMNSIEFAESFLACAKLGLAVVPLNWRLVPDELEFIIKDSGSLVMIFGGEFTANVDELHKRGPKTDIKHWIYVGPDGHCPAYARSYEQLRKAAVATPIEITSGEDDMLYIMYTSGTTGLPKGVVHTHNTTFWAIATFSSTGDLRLYDRFMLSLPMFHVGALMPLILCIYNGMSCIMGRSFDPSAAWQLIESEKVTVAILVPAMLNFMLQVPEADTCDASSLRFVLCGAAPVPDHLVLSYHKRNTPIVQVYGLTETCGPTALVSLDDYMDKLGSTGKPFFHTEVRIVDAETGQDVPVNESGELITRSKHNMIEYWNREKATRETIKDGWLYTGDVARMDADGYIYILDRSKDMIISGGENVYPAEIEGVLLTHPKIREVAVIGQASAKWGESPLAVVVKSDPSLTEAEVVGFANGKLSRFKLPKAAVFIDEIPRNPSGKVLKRLLREQFPDPAPE